MHLALLLPATSLAVLLPAAGSAAGSPVMIGLPCTRTAVLDPKNGDYFASLVGSWKRR